MENAIHQLAIAHVTQRLLSLTEGRPYFARDDFSVHMDIDRPLLMHVLRLLRIPARLSEHRIVLVTQGEANCALDMMQHSIQGPCLVMLKDKALLHIRKMSADFRCHVVACREYPIPDIGRVPSLPLSQEEKDDIEQMIRLTWRFCTRHPFIHSVVNHLVKALFETWSHYAGKADLASSDPVKGRKEEIYRKFMDLVARHGARQRALHFYADALCISIHYLCEAVHATSGHYPKYFIWQTVVSEAKYLLGYTHQSAAAIAEELNFSNPAWFSRFFKRETGLTPGEFREQVVNP